MQHRHMNALAVVGLVAACGPNPPPVVTDYNAASVKIQQLQIAAMSSPEDPAVVGEAQRICSTTGKKAEYASTTYNSQSSTATHLFLCL